MDYRKYEVQPNSASLKYRYKVVAITVYDSGHRSPPALVDIFADLDAANAAVDKLNEGDNQ